MSLAPSQRHEVDQLIEKALAEDLGSSQPESDLTTYWTVPADSITAARIVAKATGIVSGLDVAAAVFLRLDESLAVRKLVEDGDGVDVGDVVLAVHGRARPILVGERTALNFLQHLSGIASLTQTFVSATRGTNARITDTRKTIPGLRRLEKQAVVDGGGVNHRFGLYDAVLIKENHAAAAGGVDAAVLGARRRAVESDRPDTRIYAEAGTLEEVDKLVPTNPHRILLDNMDLATTREAVRRIRAADDRVEIEATGGLTLANVGAVAGVGVDFVSVGALTHSAPALDLSLLLDSPGDDTD